MTAAIDAWDRLADAWAGLAWAVTWQAAVLVGLFAIVAAGLRRASPGLRYWLWQVAAIKLLVMPLWTVAVLPPALPRPALEAAPGAGPITRPAVQRQERPGGESSSSRPTGSIEGVASQPPNGWARIASVDWRGWLMLAWILGIVFRIVAIIRQRGRLGRFLDRASPAEDPALSGLVAELSARIGLRKPPRILLANGAGSPFVCGLLRPALVLPSGLDRSLEPAPLRTVLLHELAHIRRRDLVWDWIPTIARVVYWFHPAAHYVADRARLERELACDQAAMVFGGADAAGYASTLVDVVSRSSRTGGGGAASLFRRLPS